MGEIHSAEMLRKKGSHRWDQKSESETQNQVKVPEREKAGADSNQDILKRGRGIDGAGRNNLKKRSRFILKEIVILSAMAFLWTCAAGLSASAKEKGSDNEGSSLSFEEKFQKERNQLGDGRSGQEDNPFGRLLETSINDLTNSTNPIGSLHGEEFRMAGPPSQMYMVRYKGKDHLITSTWNEGFIRLYPFIEGEFRENDLEIIFLKNIDSIVLQIGFFQEDLLVVQDKSCVRLYQASTGELLHSKGTAEKFDQNYPLQFGYFNPKKEIMFIQNNLHLSQVILDPTKLQIDLRTKKDILSLTSESFMTIPKKTKNKYLVVGAGNYLTKMTIATQNVESYQLSQPIVGISKGSLITKSKKQYTYTVEPTIQVKTFEDIETEVSSVRLLTTYSDGNVTFYGPNQFRESFSLIFNGKESSNLQTYPEPLVHYAPLQEMNIRSDSQVLPKFEGGALTSFISNGSFLFVSCQNFDLTGTVTSFDLQSQIPKEPKQTIGATASSLLVVGHDYAFSLVNEIIVLKSDLQTILKQTKLTRTILNMWNGEDDSTIFLALAPQSTSTSKEITNEVIIASYNIETEAVKEHFRTSFVWDGYFDPISKRHALFGMYGLFLMEDGTSPSPSSSPLALSSKPTMHIRGYALGKSSQFVYKIQRAPTNIVLYSHEFETNLIDIQAGSILRCSNTLTLPFYSFIHFRDTEMIYGVNDADFASASAANLIETQENLVFSTKSKNVAGLSKCTRLVETQVSGKAICFGFDMKSALVFDFSKGVQVPEKEGSIFGLFDAPAFVNFENKVFSMRLFDALQVPFTDLVVTTSNVGSFVWNISLLANGKGTKTIFGVTGCTFPCVECTYYPEECTKCDLDNPDFFILNQHSECVGSCSPGYFMQDVSGQFVCSKCDETCLECDGSATSCTKCPNNVTNKYLKAHSSECVSTCDSNQFIKEEQGDNATDTSYFSCEDCSDDCTQCSFSAGNCTSCIEGLLLREIGDCGETCFDSQIQKTNTEGKPYCVSEFCENPCQECTLSTFCTSCQNSNEIRYFLYEKEGTCHLACPEGTKEYNDPTTLVKKCEDCDSSCKDCKGKVDNCVSCYPGFVLSSQGGSCLSGCDPGEYISSVDGINQCAKCLSSCAECSLLPSNCTQCFSDQVLVYPYGSCASSCPSGQFEVENKQNGQRKCAKCSEVCETCEGSGSTCLTCDPEGKFPLLLRKMSKCAQSCEDNQFIGYLSDGVHKECKECKYPCDSCSGQSDYCQSCNALSSTPFLLQNGQCSTSCPEGFREEFVDEEEHIECFEICEEPCNRCKGSKSFCTLCESKNGIKFLDKENGKCLEECPEGQFPKESEAQNGLECVPCAFPCRTCTGIDESVQCTSCLTADGANLVLFSDGTCSDSCPDGEFIGKRDEEGEFECLSCDGSCKSCSGVSTNCTSCQNELILGYPNKNGTCSCVSHCPQGTLVQLFSDDTAKCSPCSFPCKTCSSSFTNCTSCVADFFFFFSNSSGFCLSECPENYEPNSLDLPGHQKCEKKPSKVEKGAIMVSGANTATGLVGVLPSSLSQSSALSGLSILYFSTVQEICLLQYISFPLPKNIRSYLQSLNTLNIDLSEYISSPVSSDSFPVSDGARLLEDNDHGHEKMLSKFQKYYHHSFLVNFGTNLVLLAISLLLAMFTIIMKVRRYPISNKIFYFFMDRSYFMIPLKVMILCYNVALISTTIELSNKSFFECSFFGKLSLLLALFIFVVYVLGFPFFYLVFTLKFFRRFKEPKFNHRFEALYSGLDIADTPEKIDIKKASYNLFLFYRKMIMLASMLMLYDFPNLIIFIYFVFLLVSSGWTILFMPFDEKCKNLISFLSNFSVVAMVVLLIVIVNEKSEERQEELGEIFILVGIIVNVGINVTTLLRFAPVVFRLVRRWKSMTFKKKIVLGEDDEVDYHEEEKEEQNESPNSSFSQEAPLNNSIPSFLLILKGKDKQIQITLKQKEPISSYLWLQTT